jgi:hypothetical protein
MPTQPSAAANEIASRLTTEGFDGVSPVLVQRWRERGLLGPWGHSHSGGPGSSAVATLGAYERARLLARLKEVDRNAATVSFLAFLTGVQVEVAEISWAVSTMFTQLLTELMTSLSAEPIDRAEEYVQRLVTSRRSHDQIRALSAKLDGARDPQWQPDSASRDLEQRTADVLTALLAALGGDASWVAIVLPDALRLHDMGDVVLAAELDDPVVLAEAARAFDTAVDTLFAALDRLDELTDEDLRLALETSVTWAGADAITELSDSVDPIVKPTAVTPLIVGPLLSQLATPGQLHDQIMEHYRHPDS